MIKIPAYLSRNRMLVFLSCLIVLLFSFPFFHQEIPNYLIVLELLFTLLLIVGIVIISANERLVVISALLAILATVIIWFNYVLQDPNLLLFGMLLEVCFFSVTTVSILKHVIEYNRVSSDKIYGAVSAYILVAIIMAMLYTMIEISEPNSFYFAQGIQHTDGAISAHRLYFSEFLYFSFTTITTLGYGDIIPISKIAKSLTSIEAVAGQLYVAVLIARLVGLHISHAHWIETNRARKKKKTRRDLEDDD